MPKRQTILVDLDGVLHDYHGWQGADAFGPPIHGSRAAMYLLEKRYRLVCFTTRPEEPAKRWLRLHGFPEMKVTNKKEPAYLIIDDRAITFPGAWSDQLIARITSFSPHWQAPEDVSSSEDVPAVPSSNQSVPLPGQTSD